MTPGLRTDLSTGKPARESGWRATSGSAHELASWTPAAERAAPTSGLAWRQEPSIEEVLSEPIVRALMRRDRVRISELRHLIARVRKLSAVP